MNPIPFVLLEDSDPQSLVNRANEAIQQGMVPAGGVMPSHGGHYLLTLVHRDLATRDLEVLIIGLARRVVAQADILEKNAGRANPAARPPAAQEAYAPHVFKAAPGNPGVCGCGRAANDPIHVTLRTPPQTAPPPQQVAPHQFVASQTNPEHCHYCGLHYAVQVHHAAGVHSPMPRNLLPTDAPLE